MTQVEVFTFNPFEENTYVVYDDSGACAIIDPGCFDAQERGALEAFIRTKGLRPERLINTHCHLDHVFGNRFVSETWSLPLEIHEGELPVLLRFSDVCAMYGIPGGQTPPMPGRFIVPGEDIVFGQTRLQTLYTPGHSPASVSFYCPDAGFVLAGDVLFYESIGRTDLPGGNFDTLLQSIRTQLFTLPGETLVYAGHGPATTIRHEQEYNPFL